MKTIFTLLFSISLLNLSAQWSDTNNQFYDSLHMPVCTTARSQNNSIVVRSYPDGGYFIIWEDQRTIGNNTDIYAQKYDQNGNTLWAENGVPVAVGVGWEQIAPSSNADYRNYSHAVTDSAGGLFVTYQEMAQLGSYYRTGIAVQHINPDGNVLFPDAGLIIRQPLINGSDDFGMPQIVADGRKGFYVSFITLSSGYAYHVTIEGYSFNGSTLTQYVSKIMNEGVHQKSDIGPCGLKRFSLSDYPVPSVYDYYLWPDTQGGCNVVMNMAGSDGAENTPAQKILAFNALKRVKKECTTTIFQRTNDVAMDETITHHYQKDSVIRLFNLQTFSWTVTCLPYVYTNYLLENFGLGYRIIASGFYDGYYAKGVTAGAPGGNINVNAVALSQREYINNALTPFVTKIYTWPEEIYDSLPYQRASSTQHYRAYNILQPEIMNGVNQIYDTVLNTSTYYHEFSLAATANKIYVTAKLNQPSGVSDVYLQQLTVNRINADSFAIVYGSFSKTGTLIGKERSTGFQGSSIYYDNPRIATDDAGNAVFYTREYYRFVRVSPIINGNELSWGAMGKPIGTGVYNNGLYTTERPFIVFGNSGSGVVCWDDQRNTGDNSYDNIFARHLDDLNTGNYLPPVKKTRKLAFGNTNAIPVILLSASKQWSTIDAYTNSGPANYTPVVQILDNYNLGAVDVDVYQHRGSIRLFNGKPYLDRNFVITPQNNPSGGEQISVRLHFTDEEFLALKTEEPSIIDPGSLIVVKQPGIIGNAPSAYTPVAGETKIIPTSWQAVSGGYYLEFQVSGFSSFFIENNNGALPVTWLGIQAQWMNNHEAKVSWQVADQKNVKNYIVQQSKDGINFTDECTMKATQVTSYSCNVTTGSLSINYFRVQQQDMDGRKSYSKIVSLNSTSESIIYAYPNPAKDKIYLPGVVRYTEATITDASGKIMIRNLVNSSDNFIDISRLSRGMYFLKLLSGDGMQTLKFIRE